MTPDENPTAGEQTGEVSAPPAAPPAPPSNPTPPAPPAAPAPAQGPDAAALQRENDQLRSQLASAQAGPQTAGTAPSGGLETPAERRERLVAVGDDLVAGRVQWPDPNYDGPPPWEVARAYADERLGELEHRAPYDGPGAVTHAYPQLTTGAVGKPVAELVALLSRCGYANNSVAAGENPGLVLDNTVMADVRRFCNDYKVANDPTEYEGREAGANASELATNHVGPYVWQALLVVAERRDVERLEARQQAAQSG